MKNLTDFAFSAWRDGDRAACCIHAKLPGSQLKYISFYMSKDEFGQFVSGFCSINDIGHNLRSFSDTVTFYDLNFDTAVHGVAQVNYANINFPLFVRKILKRWADKQWKSTETHQQRPVIKVSNEKLNRWVKNYGVCSGQVNLVVREESQEFFNQCNESESFKINIERLLTIGRGYTKRFYETVNLSLSKDWDGFYFSFGKVKFNNHVQSIGLNGGLVNHGKEKPDWSIHT